MTLTIRRACLHDAETLFRWRNHPDTYRWFHTPRPVTKDEHHEWLRQVWHRREIVVWIMEDRKVPVAVVRFDPLLPDAQGALKHHAKVSVTVDPEQRGKGYGVESLRVATRQALNELQYQSVVACIHPANTASIRAFTAAGYVDEGCNTAEEVILVARR